MAGQGNNETTEKPSSPPLCSCGFFGNPACLNMCSKCYREYTAEQERSKQQEARAFTPSPEDVADALAAADAASKPTPALEVAEETPAGAEKAGVAAAAAADKPTEEGDGKPVQHNTSRCFECNKRIGLTGFKCRCGYVYCATHRYAEKHQCSFDYKSAGRQTLATNNPVVAAAKVQKL